MIRDTLMLALQKKISHKSDAASLSNTRLPSYVLRGVLTHSLQLCLSRFQVHILMSAVPSDSDGCCSVSDFLKVTTTHIPLMYEATTIRQIASEVTHENAAVAAKAEMEELEGLTTKLLSQKMAVLPRQDSELMAVPINKDTVEKKLLQLFNLLDEKRNGMISFTQLCSCLCKVDKRYGDLLAETGLSEAEKRGLLCEAQLDSQNRLAYVDFVKTWAPNIFHIREMKALKALVRQASDKHTPT